MKLYNFEEIIDRRGSGSIKTDVLPERFGRSDLLPMWVADMDFRTPDFILDAIHEVCDHGILGYTKCPDAYYASIAQWLQQQHRWEIQPEWLQFLPGVVKGIALCVSHFTQPGDKIIIQPPVYYPFRSVPEQLGRTIVNNPLQEVDGTYCMDLQHLRTVIDSNCKMLILCNPHNPVGITWEKETLQELAEICVENNILVISDEIHADLSLFGHKHIPFATVSDSAQANSITLMAPSKTFNMAGIVSSFCIIPNPALRKDFFHYLKATELDQMHIFAGITTVAAYRQGAAWLQQMLAYVEQNILFVQTYLQQHLPLVKAVIPQASFLIWLDCRKLGLSQKDLVALFIDKARLALNDGSTFGPGGEGFMRMNIGCPQAIVAKALEQLRNACI
ncbi:MAG: PatB family C-S lyase [Dysgonamonadaceae bacterium]|jgi:cystathionine beta-lyase|nr:PatB family C-S lyase [Dysgonamonadaceae bacterium]